MQRVVPLQHGGQRLGAVPVVPVPVQRLGVRQDDRAGEDVSHVQPADCARRHQDPGRPARVAQAGARIERRVITFDRGRVGVCACVCAGGWVCAGGCVWVWCVGGGEGEDGDVGCGGGNDAYLPNIWRGGSS
jgi:hypothetical protein